MQDVSPLPHSDALLERGVHWLVQRGQQQMLVVEEAPLPLVGSLVQLQAGPGDPVAVGRVTLQQIPFLLITPTGS